MLGLLTIADHRYFFYGDTSAAYYGWWYHLGDLVRHGQWTTIDPHAWRAGNFSAEGQWGLWSPLVIAIGLVASVSPQVVVTGTIVKMLLALVAVLGVFRLCRSYDVPPPAAYVAAVLAPMGGMTQFLDLPTWAAGEMIWALLPWTWWALRRTMLRGANPLAALVLGYLLVSVGYVFGTIMLVVVLLACVVDCLLARDRRALLRVVVAGVLLGLVAFTVYLPGVLTASVVARNMAFEGLFTGKFSTDPLALFAAVLPTSAVHGTTHYVLPYAYLAWLLPAGVWLDWGRVRQEWRPAAGLLVFTVITFAVVDGPGHFGPLRWPLRLQPFLVTALVVLLVVLWRLLGLRVTRSRLAFSLLWVLLAGGLSMVRAPTERAGHLASIVLVGAGLGIVWWLFARGRLTWVAPVIGVVTIAAFSLQHVVYPHLPSPQRNAPNEVSTYRSALDGAVGDVLQVGRSDKVAQHSPKAARTLLIGSLWYLSGHPVQNTYTAISQKQYMRLYCIAYQGDSCPGLFHTLFSVQGTTGMTRVDLLGVSSLLLIRRDVPPFRITHPPAGWQITARTPYAVLWTRTNPIPGAGSVAWTSPGTSVSQVAAGTSSTSFRVDAVPSGGGTVVMRLLSWPGYSTSVGSLAPATDGYLVTVHLPSSAAGQTVRVAFHPPGWDAEVAAWVIALLAGAGWSVAHALRRRRDRTLRS